MTRSWKRRGATRRQIVVGGVLAASMLLFNLPGISQATHDSTLTCGGHRYEPLLLGCDNSSEDTTFLSSSNWFQTLEVANRGSGDGILAYAGNGGSALYGKIPSGQGIAVHGEALGPGPGVLGQSGTGGAGVKGVSPTTGVWGVSQNEGVTGFGDLIGVRAYSPATALKVEGRAQFSRSGVATVLGTSSTPQSSVRVNVAPITAKSMMTATLQKLVPGVFVVAAVPNVAGGYFTIHLNKPVTTSVGPISWMVIERP